MDFLSVLDQFRYITGALVSVFLFGIHAAPKRSHFVIRVAGSYVVCLGAALLFLPIQTYLAEHGMTWYTTAPYWGIMSFVPALVLMFCFEMNLCSALFRGLLGAALESVVTTILRYHVVMNLYPDLPERHTALYILIALAIYVPIYFIGYRLAAVRMQRDDSGLYQKKGRTTLIFFLIYLFHTVITSAAKVVCEFIVLPLQTEDIYANIFFIVRHFCVLVMRLISLSMMIILYYVYEAVVLQNERKMFNQLLQEKEAQYEFSRENIEMINRKCHDLKHQLRALEFAGEDERSQMLKETKKAVDFYDAVVKTGNEALDTLLTEKSVYCVNRNIRLSCMVNTNQLDSFRVVDLYTMLGNAIDNAIESVDRISDAEKKTISLSIKDQGKMLYVSVENYYAGEIVIRGGYPVTHKKDKENHGFGVKSIQLIARRYGGDIRVSTDHHIFLLQIILPTASGNQASRIRRIS